MKKYGKLELKFFTPCAASRLVTQDQVNHMIASGLEVISCGANVPFADKEIFLVQLWKIPIKNKLNSRLHIKLWYG